MNISSVYALSILAAGFDTCSKDVIVMKFTQPISHLMKSYFGIIMISLLIVSCNKAPKFVYEDEYDTENVVEVFVSDENGNTVKIAGGSVIGVYLVDANGNITFQEVEVSEDGSVSLPSSAGGMLAYLPYQEEWDTTDFTTPRVFSVKEDQSSQAQYDASDLMIGVTDIFTRASSVLSMNYMLSKVKVHIIDDTGSYNFSNCEMELVDVCDAVDVYLSRIEVETDPNSFTDIRMMKYSETDRRLSVQAIVAPQKITAETQFMKFISPLLNEKFGVPQDTNMESGKSYNFTLRLTEAGLVYDGSYITGWVDDGGGNLFFEE